MAAPELAALDASNDTSTLGCPKFFDMHLRDQWVAVSGERYHIDSSGRPDKAATLFPPAVAEDRIESCQHAVGQWGDDADPEHDYDGGHLIGAQLGGWGARANMVPQVANFNRGNWAQLENAVAACDGDLEDGRIEYRIFVGFSYGVRIGDGWIGGVRRRCARPGS